MGVPVRPRLAVQTQKLLFDAENSTFCKKNAKKFAYIKKKQYFCTRFRENPPRIHEERRLF